MGIVKNHPTPEDLAALRARCSGKKGDSDSETVLSRSADEEDQGFVAVFSARGADIARIIDRCGSQILWYHEEGEGESVDLKISTKVFRGIEYAFTPVDKEKKPFPGREHIESKKVEAAPQETTESTPPEDSDADLPLWKKQVKKALAKKGEK